MGGSNERSGGVEDPILRRTARLDAQLAELQRRTTEAVDRSAKLLEEAKALNEAGARAERAERRAALLEEAEALKEAEAEARKEAEAEARKEAEAEALKEARARAERAEQRAQLRLRDRPRPPRDSPPRRDRTSPRLETPVGPVARPPARSRSTGSFVRSAVPWALQPRVRTFLVLGIVGLPLLVALIASQILPSFLWFRELGQEDLFVRIQEVKLLLTVVVGGVTASFLLGNAWLAIRHAPSPLPIRSIPVAIWASTLIAAILGWSARGGWQAFLLWAHRQPFGIEDPLHHRDIGFFVFSLPFLLQLSNLLILIVAMGLTLAILVHVHTGAVTWRPLTATHPARVHLALLGSLALLVLAWRLYLATFSAELVQTHPGQSQAFPGPHYVDAHVRLLGLRLLSYVAVAAAVGLAAAPFLASRGRLLAAKRAAIWPLAALGVIAVVAESWAPTLVQRYVVNTNPIAREAPFLEHAIAGTRHAFGLAGVDVHQFVPKPRITPVDVRSDQRQLDNVQLWDTDILHQQMEQLASKTPFYRPSQPTLDAVPTGGRSRLTLIGERELDVGRVQGSGQGWNNSRLVYTHGFGAFRFSGTRFDRTGGPVSDNGALPVRQPRIYFGRQQSESPDWVAVNTRRREFDSPTAAEAGRPTYHYKGSGGIALSNPLLRAAFALRLGSLPLLISKEFTSRSRIILHRDVLDRLRTLAPFLRWDPDPSALIARGRIVFLVAGYTVSDSYPYAQRVSIAGSQAAYARPSVQATVDAYSGRVRLYATDRRDPILRAWTAAFPELFEPISRMPQGIRDRLRYPPALFDAQAELYRQFHMTHPEAFASGADSWSMPTSVSGPLNVVGSIRFDGNGGSDAQDEMRPSYRFGTPAGAQGPHLLRSAYYSPRDGQNLVGTLDGWIGRRGEPKLSSRSLPREHVTLGPAQVSRLVFLTPRIAKALGVRNKELSDVGKSSVDAIWIGSPHIVFFAGGVMQIQTVYDVSSGRGVATRFGVTVFLNGRAGFGDTVTEALRKSINLPPDVKLNRPPAGLSVHQAVPIGFQVTNGLTETVRISSRKGTIFVKRLRVRDGPATVQWMPQKPGRFEAHVSVRGIDGSKTADRGTLNVKPGPPSGGPTVQFSQLAQEPVVGSPLRIQFKVTNALAETLRIGSRQGNGLTWHRQVRTGRGAINWVPQQAGPARLSITVSGAHGHTVRQSTDLTVRKPGHHSARGP
jgi:uncharacterized membrane protein (UPF0182 family)